jgi:hypothetical protein
MLMMLLLLLMQLIADANTSLPFVRRLAWRGAPTYLNLTYGLFLSCFRKFPFLSYLQYLYTTSLTYIRM